MNKIFTGENKKLLVNNVEELTIPKISVFLFVHDIIVKEKLTLQNFCRGQGGTETYVNDVNRKNNKSFCCTILKIAVVGHENIRESFHNRFVCLI